MVDLLYFTSTAQDCTVIPPSSFRKSHAVTSLVWRVCPEQARERGSTPVEALKRHEMEHQAAKEVAESKGRPYEVDDLVCRQSIGKPCMPNAFSRGSARLIREKNLAPICFHGLRHSDATLLFMAREHPKVVQERLGHSTINTTMNTCAHVIPSMQKDSAKKANDLPQS